MGEVLAKKTNELSTETLTWNDIEIEDDSCLIHIKLERRTIRRQNDDTGDSRPPSTVLNDTGNVS